MFRNFENAQSARDIFNAYLNAIESEKSNSKEKQIDNMASVLQSQVNQILSQQALSRHWLAKSRNMFDRKFQFGTQLIFFFEHHQNKNNFCD